MHVEGELFLAGERLPRAFRFALTMARRSISRRKFRSALTILGVVIGIATMVSLMTIGHGVRSQVEATLNEILGAGLIVSGKGGGIEIPEYVREYVLQVPGVKDAVPIITAMAYIRNQPVTVIGVDPEQVLSLYHLTFEVGGPLKPESGKGAVLGSATASELGVHINDTISISTQSGGVGESFVVVGILRAVGSGTLDAGCFLSLEDAQELFGREGYVSAIMIMLEKAGYERQVEEALREMFPEARIIKQEELLRNINRIMNIINGVLLALSSISLGVGALGIINTIMMSVNERRREIGMLKAVGAERRHILILFLSEALLISLIGGILGCILGLAGVRAIQWLVAKLGLNLTVNVGILSLQENTKDAWLYDAPRYWAENNYQIPQIIEYRSELVNSRFKAHIKDTRNSRGDFNKMLDIEQEIGMASRPVDIEIKLDKKPRFRLSSDPYTAPMGPNARLKKAKITENPKIHTKVDKVVSDTDLKAADAVIYLYEHDFDENFLTKLLSVGSLGLKHNRKPVSYTHLTLPTN